MQVSLRFHLRSLVIIIKLLFAILFKKSGKYEISLRKFFIKIVNRKVLVLQMLGSSYLGNLVMGNNSLLDKGG